MNQQKLVAAAHKAKQNSHSPYSRFRVGAALLTRSGKIITGCNIEVSSYSLTLCAERVALFKAISEGHRRFEAIAIATDLKEFVPACGACRQALLDLAGNIDVILCDAKKRTKKMRLKDLLPMPFDDSLLHHS